MSKIVGVKVVTVIENDDGTVQEQIVINRTFNPSDKLSMHHEVGIEKNEDGSYKVENGKVHRTGHTTFELRLSTFDPPPLPDAR